MEADDTYDGGRTDTEHTDTDDAGAGSDGATTSRTRSGRTAVPVFYTIPEAVADRALARFRERLDAHRAGDVDRVDACLREYVYDEIHEQPVIYVGDTPLAEYAGGEVPVLDTADLERGGDGSE